MLVKCGSADITNRVLSCVMKGNFNDGLIIGQCPSFQLDLSLNNKDDFFNDKLNELFYYTEPNSTKEYVFVVYEMPERYTKELKLKLYDRSYELDIAYATQLDYASGTVTVENQINEISYFTGFQFDVSAMPDYVKNRIVTWYDNTITIRSYLKWIAELFASNVFAEGENTFVFKQLSKEATHTTDIASDYLKGELFTISRVYFDNSIIKAEQGDTTGNTVYVSCNNLYVEDDNKDEIVQGVYDIIGGLSVYTLSSMTTKNIADLQLGSILNYNDEYLFMITDISSKLTSATSVLQTLKGEMVTTNEEKQVNKISNLLRIRKLTVEFDQEKQRWQVVAQQTDEKITTLGSQIDSLNTSLTLEQGKIETLIKDNTTIINGNEVTLKEAYSYIKQEVDAINFAISETGGNNKLLNSTGWNGIKYWDSDGDVASETNNDIRNNTISGYSFLINNGHIEQSFKTIVGRKYSISCKIKKFTNSCTFVIKNGTSNDVLFNLNEEYVDGWVVFSMPIEAADTHCSVYIESNGEYLYVSDIMVNDGEIVQQWSSSNDEVYTTNVKIDGTGVEVSQVDTNNRTVMNTNEFAGYDGEKKVFALNGDTTEVNKLKAASDVQIGVVKAYSLTKGTKIGLGFAFIKGGDA